MDNSTEYDKQTEPGSLTGRKTRVSHYLHLIDEVVEGTFCTILQRGNFYYTVFFFLSGGNIFYKLISVPHKFMALDE